MNIKIKYTKKPSKWFMYLGLFLAIFSLTGSVYFITKADIKNCAFSLVMSLLLFFACWQQYKSKEQKEQIIKDIDSYEVI